HITAGRSRRRIGRFLSKGEWTMLDSSWEVTPVACYRKKRTWVAALCTASFVTGQVLFGHEARQPPAAPKTSLISQYMQAKNQMATGEGQRAGVGAQDTGVGSQGAEKDADSGNAPLMAGSTTGSALRSPLP